MAKVKMIAEGDRVRVKGTKEEGTVFHIEKEALLVHHWFPIQVELDKPCEDGQTFKRYSLKEIVIIEEAN